MEPPDIQQETFGISEMAMRTHQSAYTQPAETRTNQVYTHRFNAIYTLSERSLDFGLSILQYTVCMCRCAKCKTKMRNPKTNMREAVCVCVFASQIDAHCNCCGKQNRKHIPTPPSQHIATQRIRLRRCFRQYRPFKTEMEWLKYALLLGHALRHVGHDGRTRFPWIPSYAIIIIRDVCRTKTRRITSARAPHTLWGSQPHIIWYTFRSEFILNDTRACGFEIQGTLSEENGIWVENISTRTRRIKAYNTHHPTNPFWIRAQNRAASCGGRLWGGGVCTARRGRAISIF